MRPLSYARATDVDSAIATAREHRDSAFLAGGTTEVDLVRQNVLRPGLLVDINDLPLNRVEDLPGGGLRIGALARMSDVARAPWWNGSLSSPSPSSWEPRPGSGLSRTCAPTSPTRTRH